MKLKCRCLTSITFLPTQQAAASYGVPDDGKQVPDDEKRVPDDGKRVRDDGKQVP